MKVERETADASDDVAKSKHKKKVEREAVEASDDADRSKAKKKVEREAADATRSPRSRRRSRRLRHGARRGHGGQDSNLPKTAPKKRRRRSGPDRQRSRSRDAPAAAHRRAGRRREPRPNSAGRRAAASSRASSPAATTASISPLPEGTSVRAAENGTVAYAGSELKGYGNLVLIRHPNGFVSAYANNGELDVKRGDMVKRGQVIAKSGQSGNVSSPQLHFELRKGSTPVDPTSYLAGL